MTKREAKLTESVKTWANRLGIGNYKYIVHIVKPEDMEDLQHDDGTTHDYAQVITSEEKQEVEIYINEKYLKEEPNETENTVVHELVHARLNLLMESITDTINSYVSDKNSKEFLCKQLGKIEHQVVVGITRALVEEK